MASPELNGGRRRVAIVGAGIAGLAVGLKMKRAGYPFTIFEKADEVGGTWRDNTYPGLRIDVPGPIYTFSEDRAADWSHLYCEGHEVQSYITGFADRFGLREHIRFGAEIVEARWTGAAWVVRTAGGDEDEFDLLLQATGFLHQPRWPEIPGLESFAGEQCHSARFDHSIQLDGRRVGVIGNGSTGVQLTTELAGRASHFTSFQRTPQWVFPAPNMRIPRLFRRLIASSDRVAQACASYTQWSGEMLLGRAARADGWQRRLLGWAARRYLSTVKDPALRERLTPKDAPLCKRPVISTKYYAAVQRPDVEVITDAIDRIEPAGVRTADGRLHELDVLILATGFQAHNYMRPMNVIGEDGLTLDEAWADGPQAYRTIAMPGFPNMFTILGPHTPLVSIALHTSAELAGDYVLQAIEVLERPGVVAVQPTEQAARNWYSEIGAGFPGTVWSSGCSSWYVGSGDVPVLWPYDIKRWTRMLSAPDWSEFEIVAAEPATAAEPVA